MTNSQSNSIAGAVQERAHILILQLKRKAFDIGFSISAVEEEDALSQFSIICLKAALRYSPMPGGLALDSYLFACTQKTVEAYLRERRAAKRVIIREAQEIYRKEDKEHLPDESGDDIIRSDFWSEVRRIRSVLTPEEDAFLQVLEECDGNVCKSARILGISEKRGRNLRASLAEKFAELKNYGADFAGDRKQR